MSAPIQAYRNKSMWMRKGSTDYQHLFAILQVSASTMKARFYLDSLFNSRLPDGTDGVIGVCNEGSANYAMHASARRGVGRCNAAGVMMNDGGLNTLGFAKVEQVPVTAANRIKVESTFTSAWYTNTTNRGLQWKLSSSGLWNNFPVYNGTIAQQVSITVEDWMIDQMVSPGDTINIRAWITNEEGTFYSAVVNVELTQQILDIGAIVVVNINDTTGTPAYFFMYASDHAALASLTTSATNSGIIGYKDPEMTIPIDAGLYSQMIVDSDKVLTVDSNGQFTKYTMAIYPILGFELTDNGTYTDVNVQGTNCYYNINLSNISAQSRVIDIRLLAFGESIANTYYATTNMNDASFAGSEMRNFNGVFNIPAGVDTNVFTLSIQASDNNGTSWYEIGAITGLAHDNQ